MILFKIFGENQDLRFLRLQWSSIAISKILNLNFLQKIPKKWLKVRKHSPQMWQFCFFWYVLDQCWCIFLVKKSISKLLLFCPLENRPFPIDLQKRGAQLQNSIYKFLLLDSGPYDSHTSLCQRAACTIEWCSNVDTLYG